MSSFRCSLNRFVHRWIYLVSYIAFNAFIIFSFLQRLQPREFLGFGPYVDFLKDTCNYGVFCFVYFLFLSYEFTSELNRVAGLEMVESIEGGERKSLMGQLLFLVVTVVPTFAVTVVFSFVRYKAVNLATSGLFHHTWIVLLRYVFAPALSGILLGAVLRNRSRTLAYACMVLSGLFVTEIPRQGFGNIAIGGFELARVFDWFQLAGSGMRYATDGVYGIPIEPARMVLPLIWINLFLFIIVFSMRGQNRKKYKLLSLSFLLIGVLCSAFFVSRINHSIKYTDNRPSSYMQYPERGYYAHNKEEIERINSSFAGQNNKQFTVTKYDLSFRATTNLYARAELALDNPNLKEYLFTLHHSYKVTAVYDENSKKIPYKRICDYLILYPEAELTTFTCEYKGVDNVKYFSNWQNMTLPAYHCYFPRSGAYCLWDYGSNSYRANADFYPADFTVKVDANYLVESNLDKIGHNTFSGSAESVTLLGGYINSVNKDGVDYVYGPMSGQKTEFDVEMANRIGNDVKDFLGIDADFSFTGKKLFFNHIFLKQSGWNEGMVIFSDHVICSDIQPYPTTLFNNYVNSIIPQPRSQKGFMGQSLMHIKQILIEKILSSGVAEVKTKPDFSELAFLKEYEEKYAEEDLFKLTADEWAEYSAMQDKYNRTLDLLGTLVDYQISVNGKEAVLKAIYNYLIGESDQHYIDFLYNLDNSLSADSVK